MVKFGIGLQWGIHRVEKNMTKSVTIEQIPFQFNALEFAHNI